MAEYPTEEKLKTIREWDVSSSNSVRELLEYIEDLWWVPDWGFALKGKVGGQ